jgi:hypothetical protein
METLKIHIYESGKSKPDQVITIPLSKLNVGKKLIPTKAKTSLGKEGIDISRLGELAGKSISKGVLIEVESGNEKIVISVE